MSASSPMAPRGWSELRDGPAGKPGELNFVVARSHVGEPSSPVSVRSHLAGSSIGEYEVAFHVGDRTIVVVDELEFDPMHGLFLGLLRWKQVGEIYGFLEDEADVPVFRSAPDQSVRGHVVREALG